MCVSVFRNVKERVKEEGGMCGLSRHSFINGVLLSEQSLQLGIDRIGGISVYEINGRIVVVICFLLFFKFCIFCTRGKEPNVTNIIPIR